MPWIELSPSPTIPIGPPYHRASSCLHPWSHPLTGTGVSTFIVKGAWAATRLGKLMLPDYKRALAEDVSFFELLDTLFALLAIGTRAKNTRAEIVKALRAASSTARTPQAKRLREVMGREVQLSCELTAQLLESPAEELEAAVRRTGESYFRGGRGCAEIGPDAAYSRGPCNELPSPPLLCSSFSSARTNRSAKLRFVESLALTYPANVGAPLYRALVTPETTQAALRIAAKTEPTEIAAALRGIEVLKDSGSRAAVEKLTTHSDTEVAKAAKQALAHL